MIPCIFSKSDGRILEPLTCYVPVPLITVCGKPVIEYTADILKKSGFSRMIVSTAHKNEAVQDYFSRNPPHKISVGYDTSDISDDETVLLINADTFYSMSFENSFRFHKNKKADMTVITKSVNDCRENRAVFTGNDKKILSFQDNPTYMDCVSSADTGIYIVSARIFRIIENSDGISDILLNRLISEGFSIYASECIGYFRNIDSVKNYIKCQNDVLCGTVTADINGHRTLDGSIIYGSYDLRKASAAEPLCIGNNVSASTGTVIDNLSVIGNNVTIGRNSSVHNSVIMDGAYIGDRVTCTNAVICRNAVLLNSCSVYDGCIIGEEAVVGENTTVRNNAGVWNYKNTGSNKNICFPLRYGHSSEIKINEYGISGETNAVITAHTAVSAGMSLGGRNKSLVIGYAPENNSAYAMALAASGGIMSAGGTVWNIGECLPCEMDFAIRNLCADGGIYIESDNITKIIPSAANAMPFSSAQENSLEYSVNHHICNYAAYNEFGDMTDISVYRNIYFRYLKNILPQSLDMSVSVNTSNSQISRICKELFESTDMKKDEYNSIVFHISSDSRKVSAYSEMSGFVFHEKLIMLCCDDFMSKGSDIALPYGITRKIEEIAEKYGRKVFRYSENNSGYDLEIFPPDFISDGFSLMTRILRILSERKLSLSDAVSQLPQSASSSKFVSIEKSPSEIIRRLCGNSPLPCDGTVLESEKGRVSVKPSRSGKSIMVYAEAANYEFAKELCSFVEKNINKSDNCN